LLTTLSQNRLAVEHAEDVLDSGDAHAVDRLARDAGEFFSGQEAFRTSDPSLNVSGLGHGRSAYTALSPLATKGLR
jgi:hypothetical protein